MAMNEPREPREPRHGTEPQDVQDVQDVQEVLPCGRDLADLWDRQDGTEAGDARSAGSHAATCGHCAAALADFARLRRAVLRDAREAQEAQETGADGEEAVSRLTANIMDVVRLELRPGRTLALGEMDEDSWIYEAVAARTFRTAAERVPGVQAGSCRVSPGPGPRTGDRTPAHVRIEVTVGTTRDLPLTADRIREQVARAARQALGMHIASIDVAVTDLHHETSGEAER
ncbi:hypothetical protein ACIQV3_20910 [Streptomyces sp. NPDC099050]|uniref:hypothetical protein n=1 Tax=Streptomyces sp. NPDC099050 TaxID=3366100 RepID=UPI003820BC90